MIAKIQYRIVIEPIDEADGGGFLATVPDLPGCVADGETDIEALQNAHDAIDSWLAKCEELGRRAPEPQRQYA
jgi:predicted RNase H-like HicB family nuclease